MVNNVMKWINPLSVEFFCYPPIGTKIIFYIPSPRIELIFLYLLFGTDFFLFFVSFFFGLRIEAPPLSTVKAKCIYKIFKAENQETQFPHFCTKPKPSIDKHKFSSFQGWQFQGRFIGHLCLACTISSVDISAICA